MIFGPEMLTKVLSGRKTETRRPDKGGDSRYKIGRTYAAQPGRGRKAVGRIRINYVYREALCNMDDEAAKREGFERLEDFGDYWYRLHGPADDGQPFSERTEAVWVIGFELEG